MEEELELEPVSVLLFKKIILSWQHVLNYVTVTQWHDPPENTVCTDHIDFPMLFAKLQVFGQTDVTYTRHFLF